MVALVELSIEFVMPKNQVRVGSGEQKDSRCGQFLGFKGCLNVDLHKHKTLDGEDHSGKVYIKRIYHSCDRPECKVCFKSGWAVREAGKVEERLKEASKRFGVIEHVIDSPLKSEYMLPFEKLKANSLKAVRARHLIGGLMIYHAQRFANPFEAKRKNVPAGWRFAPHFHYLGFIDGGYGSCRRCSNVWLDDKGSVHVIATDKCLICKKGFEGLTRRLNVTDGHIVKVKGARKTIFGTAFYQLNHATIVRTSGKSKESRVGRWFGVCSYVKLKLKKEDRVERDVCKICGYALVPVKYVGAGEPLEGQWWFDEFEDDYLDDKGVPKWIEIPKEKNYGY